MNPGRHFLILLFIFRAKTGTKNGDEHGFGSQVPGRKISTRFPKPFYIQNSFPIFPGFRFGAVLLNRRGFFLTFRGYGRLSLMERAALPSSNSSRPDLMALVEENWTAVYRFVYRVTGHVQDA